ncbi:MAG: DUF502 domain-containing protein [Pseudomonadota bacterium]
MAKKKQGTTNRLIKPLRRTAFQRMRGNFFAGIVLVGPVALTVYLAWTAITLIDETIVPWVPSVYNPRTYLDADIPGFGVIVVLLFTTFVGWLTKNFFGRQIVRWGEGWVSRMPVIRSIYNALKQIAETILSQSKSSFKEACLIEYPRKGIWAIAFVSTDTKGEIPSKASGGEMMSVFLPTTPNPTSGFLLFVPRPDVVLLDMTVEEAAKLVISAGLVTPPTKEEIKAGMAKRRTPEPVG